MNLNTRLSFGIMGALLFSFSPSNAQINTYIRAIRPVRITEQQKLTVAVEIKQSSELNRVSLMYRQFGQSEFRSLEMQIVRDSAFAEIPANEVAPPFIELYVIALTQNNTIETFPIENPEVAPARIIVDVKEQAASEIIVLSPEEGAQIQPGETYISISFVYADESVDRAKTKIILNGIDLSSKAVLFDDLLIVPPEAIPAEAAKGTASLEIQTFDTAGRASYTLKRGFAVITPQQAEAIQQSFQVNGNAQAESRTESIKGEGKTYNRLDVRTNGSYLDFLKATANLSLSSEEKPENQPQNRYFLGLDARYAKLGIGDAYPRFPYVIMDGRRIRGITGDLLLGFFNVNAATGEVSRYVEINSTPQTLKRTMNVVRPSFGKGESFQWGFTYMNAKDDFDAGKPIVVRPQQNAVFGSDLMFAVDNHRIEFTAQTALSLNNVDISSPEFSRDSIDSAVARKKFSQEDGDQLKKYLPILSKVIIANENLIPVNPAGATSLVYETGLSFNYFGNYLKGSYIFHGKDYTSAGATTIRKDIRGFNVMDRLRLLENKLFLSASVEQLENNTSGYEIATTTYKTINSSISYFPSRDYPNITIGYGYNTNSNPINPFDTTGVDSTSASKQLAKQIALRAMNDNTNRFYFQSTYDFSYVGQHSLTFNFDISNKTDLTPKQQNISTYNTFLLITTTHTAKLESTLGISLSGLKYPQSDTSGMISETSLSYQTLTLGGRYKLYEDILRLTATLAPTFGDFARTLFETGLQYNITDHQLAALQFQFIANSSSAVTTQTSKNDSYISLLYRIDF
ncbi:MAG: hypothetical protein PHP42_09950 [Bacteroidota bacterium]|nr:hypothetical protein [Bacteroidota bacterium]